MNTDMVRALAKHIEVNEQLDFNMAQHETCAMAYLAMIVGREPGFTFTTRDAAEILDVTQYQAQMMFLHAPYRKPDASLKDIPRDEVVQALRYWANSEQVPNVWCPRGWDKVEG